MAIEEFRIIVKYPGEARGRAYLHTKHQVVGRGEFQRKIPMEIIRQRPGLGSAPTWTRKDGESIIAALADVFPGITAELKRA